MSWTDHLFDMAAVVASKSKDPNTKVGAVIVGQYNEIKATGFNGLPIGVMDLPERLERPKKYLFVCHAEANAIAFAARNGHRLDDARLYCTHMPCNECAKLIIQAGVSEVYYDGRNTTSMPAELFEAAEAMFEEADVILKEYRGHDTVIRRMEVWT